MKPTVGRFVHTRLAGRIHAALIVDVDEKAGDTRNGPVPIDEVRVFCGHQRDLFWRHINLYDTEVDVPPDEKGACFWPDRMP